MIESLHTVIYWTGALTWVSLVLLFIVALFSGKPFVGPEDVYEPQGDASAYPKSLHNARRANHRETEQ
jgi:hypothetical protein